MIARENGTLTIYIEPADVLCSGSIEVKDDGALLVKVSDGCREFEVPAAEAEVLYQELGTLRRRKQTALVQTQLPSESSVGQLHLISENFSGELDYLGRRRARYAGAGRWEVMPGGYALWHTQGGSVRGWSAPP